MEKDWVKIFSTNDIVKAEMVKALLNRKSIPAVVINKKESLTVIVGEAEVYVNRNDAMKAINLVKSSFDA